MVARVHSDLLYKILSTWDINFLHDAIIFIENTQFFINTYMFPTNIVKNRQNELFFIKDATQLTKNNPSETSPSLTRIGSKHTFISLYEYRFCMLVCM